MEDVVYFLVPKSKKADVSQDFKKLISWLSGQNLELTKELENKYKIKYNDRPHVAGIELSFPNSETDTGKMILRVLHGDSYSVLNIKEFANSFNYRIYNLELGCFIPSHPHFRDLTTLQLSSELTDAFSIYDMEPIYLAEMANNSKLFYARKKGGKEVYVINPFLLNYHMNWKKVTAKSSEFSYEVAENINRFTQYVERGLVPYMFYEKYGKDIKIYNDSGIDVENPDRKIFIKPIVAEIDEGEPQFFTEQNERGSFILMTKIEKGGNLDSTINSLLKEQKMADGYVRASVSRNIEFDTDKAGVLTPRLIVHIYVEKLLKQPEGINRNWDSIKN